MCYPTPSPSPSSPPVPAVRKIGTGPIGVKLDTLAHNGQRLLKLPSARTLPSIKGVELDG